jgi:hypothetical protein
LLLPLALAADHQALAGAAQASAGPGSQNLLQILLVRSILTLAPFDARHYWLLLAEGHLTRRLFGAMVEKVAALPVPTP